MSETLNPISSYDYPTDNEFSELREVGKELVEKQKVEDELNIINMQLKRAEEQLEVFKSEQNHAKFIM